MKAILFVSCLFIFNKSKAFVSDTLLSEQIKAGDTLMVRSEYSGCKGLTQKEAKIFYDGSKVNILFFDSLEMQLVPKSDLSPKQAKAATRILEKYKAGKRLTEKEKKYVNVNLQNSMFDFYTKYLRSDTVFLDISFESAKEKLILFEKTLKKDRDSDKSLCIERNGNCRVKTTMNINNEKRKHEYYSDGCADTNARLLVELNK